MKKLLFIFPVLSYLLLAAHELRTGQYLYMAAWILLAVLILVWQRPWVRHVCIFSLMLGLFIWIRVTIGLLRFRFAFEEPYTLLLVIMGSVAGLIIFSIYLMFTKTMQKRFE